MTATVAAKPFAAALARVAGAVASRNSYPILACVRIEIAGGMAILIATDLDIEVTTTVPADGEAGPFCVEAARLTSIMGRLKDKGDVKIDFAPLELVISAGRSRYTLPTLDPESFPTLAIGSEAHTFTVASDDLCAVFSAAAPAVHDGDDRAYLCGIHVEAGALADPRQKDTIVIAATNGKQMYARNFPAPGIAADMAGLTVPGRSCALIAKLFSGVGEVAITLNRYAESERIKLVGGATTLITKLVEGHFPDWRRVMPATPSTYCFDTKSLINSLENAMAAAASSKAKGVKLTFGEDETEIALRTLPGEVPAEGLDVCSHSILGKPTATEIGIDARYLIEMLNSLGAETSELAIVDAGSPVVVRGATLDDRRAVVMPMRV